MFRQAVYGVLAICVLGTPIAATEAVAQEVDEDVKLTPLSNEVIFIF